MYVSYIHTYTYMCAHNASLHQGSRKNWSVQCPPNGLSTGATENPERSLQKTIASMWHLHATQISLPFVCLFVILNIFLEACDFMLDIFPVGSM